MINKQVLSTNQFAYSGASAALQIAHSGRKASTYAPWLTDALTAKPPFKTSMLAPPEANGWTDVWAPSSLACVRIGHFRVKVEDMADCLFWVGFDRYDEKHATPSEMSLHDIETVKHAFVDAARRAMTAGYDVLESKLQYLTGWFAISNSPV